MRTRARDHGGHKEVYRGGEYDVDPLPKIMLEMIVPAGRKDEMIRTLVEVARTGKIGDGKILVSGIQKAIRIRDDQRGEPAL